MKVSFGAWSVVLIVRVDVDHRFRRDLKTIDWKPLHRIRSVYVLSAI